MTRAYFLSLILCLLAVWAFVYAEARHIYSGVHEYQARAKNLERKVEQVLVHQAVEREAFLEFQQYVATLMPEVLKREGLGEGGYPLRSLASTISRSESEQIRKTIANTLFLKGKEYFRERDFAKANRAFRQLIERYGYSPYTAEAHFLLAESLFQTEDLESCTRVILDMIELFPQHELTGFAMVRLGRIYQLQNRTEEAIDIYRTVLRSYPQRDVASQAKDSLRGLEL